MFYQRLQARLNETMSPHTGLNYTVINLAMAGSISYQNFVALNIWGHALAPDAIISYAGGNDLFVPIMTGSDAWLTYNAIAARDELVHVEPGRLSRFLNNQLPAIAAYTGVKGYLEGAQPMLRRQYLQKDRYNSARGFKGKDAVFEVALPTYTHALQSIKRDFQGMPMLVMFQAIDWRQAFPYLEAEYAEFTRRAEARLGGYMNERWVFLNLHDHWNEHQLWDEAILSYGLHLPSHLQELVARLVVEKTPQWFWQRNSQPAETASGDGAVDEKLSRVPRTTRPLAGRPHGLGGARPARHDSGESRRAGRPPPNASPTLFTDKS
jgi:hypothetical protein